MFFSDALALGAPKRTKEGFLAVRARAARAGVYDYRGSEIDPTGQHFAADRTVKVYRPADEVFAKDSVHSFLLKPVTDDHPSVPVTADNWKQHARGVNAGAMRDGDFLAFDLVIMDKAAIAAIDSGKRELSNGYSSEIEIKSGTTDAGEHYDAIQRNIRGNHIALVDAGRAGPLCRIGDASICDSIQPDVLDRLISDGQTYRGAGSGDNFSPTNSNGKVTGADQMKSIIHDGISIEVNDQAATAYGVVAARLATADANVATLTTQLATKDAELITAQAQLADAKLTPAQLRDAAIAFQRTIDKAKALGVAVTDSMDTPAIERAVVLAKVGDVSKDWNDAQISASFATLSSDAAPKPRDPAAAIIAAGAGVIADTATIRNAARSSRYAN